MEKAREDAHPDRTRARGDARPPTDIGRKRPAHGVFIASGEPTIVFVTVCTKHRVPWLASEEAQRLVRGVWSEAEAWLLGHYVLMPDHAHFFCAPSAVPVTLERWVSYWKRICTQRAPNDTWRWQSGHWDTRLRRHENYTEKWEYVRQNHVRAGLVTHPDAWPYQGELNFLPW